MLVGQRILDCLDQRDSLENLLSHLVHGGLHTGAVVLRKDLESDVPRSSPCVIKLGDLGLDRIEVRKHLPVPVCIDFGAENPVPRLLEGRVLVAHEAPELGVGALQHQETGNPRVDLNSLALRYVNLNVPRLVAVTQERMRVGLAVDRQTGPAVSDNVDVGRMDMSIFLDEVSTQDRSKQLWRSDGVLLGQDVDGVLDRIRGYDNAVVGLGVSTEEMSVWRALLLAHRVFVHLRRVNFSLDQHTDGHLDHRLDTRLLVPDDLAKADIVLAIAGRNKFGSHDDSSIVESRGRNGLCLSD